MPTTKHTCREREKKGKLTIRLLHEVLVLFGGGLSMHA